MHFMENTISETKHVTLRPHCLSFFEVIGQSIANIAPSAGAALFIPATFAVSQNGTWLTFIFSTIALVLVGYQINHFARKSATPGALYSFVTDGLGEGAGFISGSGLVIAYMLTASAVLAGFTNYADVLLGYLGISIPFIVLLAFAVISAWFVTYKDVKISAKVMLFCEAFSIALIVALCIIVVAKSPTVLDANQFQLKGVSGSTLTSGLVLAIFSYVGFESATTLGMEARSPLRNIPRAVIISTVCIGIFYMLISYIETLGFIGSPDALNASPAPLKYLAEHNGVGILGVLTTVGCLISFWSCAIASITAGSRILFTMAHNRLIANSFTKIHASNATPHFAVSILSITVFIAPATLFILGQHVMDVFSWLATIATYGFLLVYLLISIAAPVYLRKRGELKPVHIIVSAITCIVMLIPIVGSVYPVQAFPFNIFPIIFVAWMIISAVWFKFASDRRTTLAGNAVG
jgi:Amino acid transporters